MMTHYLVGKKLFLAFVLSLGLQLAVAQAIEPIFFDNFQSYSGRITSSSEAGSWTSNLGATGANYFEVVQDTGNLFGERTSNKLLHFHVETATGAALRLQDGFSGGDVITVSFMLYQSPSSVRSVDLRSGTDNIGGTNIAQRLSMGSGQITGGGTASFPVAEAVRVDMIINNSASALTDYHLGSGTLGSQMAAIWIDGVLQGNDLTQGRTIPAGTSLSSIAFQTLSSQTGIADFMLDWVAVYDGAHVMSAIPEPKLSFAIVVVGVAVCAFCGRRKRNKGNVL